MPSYGNRLLHAYYKLPMLLREDLNALRFRDLLESECGIENGTIYDPPCHQQPVFQHLPAVARSRCPIAESTLRRQFCPPMHSAISAKEVVMVVEAMRDVMPLCVI